VTSTRLAERQTARHKRRQKLLVQAAALLAATIISAVLGLGAAKWVSPTSVSWPGTPDGTSSPLPAPTSPSLPTRSPAASPHPTPTTVISTHPGQETP